MIDDFSGGLNFSDPPGDLQPNELNAQTRNFETFGKGRELRTRRALSHIDEFSGAFPVGGTSNNALSSIFAYDGGASLAVSTPNGYAGRAVFGTGISDGGQVNITQMVASSTTFGGREFAFEQSADTANVQELYMSNGVTTPQRLTIATGTVVNWPGTPPNGNILKSWKTMMLVAGVSAQPQRLYFSTINNPESWPANNFIDIKSVDDENDKIVGLEVIGENLLVFKANSVWLVYDSATFDNRRITNIGLVNRHCTAPIEDRVYWLNINGVYSTDGEDVRLESKNIEGESSLVGQILPLGYANSQLSRFSEAYDDRLIWFLGNCILVLETGITRPDGQHPWFLHYSTPVSKICDIARMTHLDGSLELVPVVVVSYHGLDGANHIAHFLSDETGPNPLGQDFYYDGGPHFSAVESIYESPWLPIHGVENYERMRRVNLLLKGDGNEVGHVEGFVDFNDTVKYTQNFTIPNTANTDTYVVRTRPELRGRYHRVMVKLDQTYMKPVGFLGVEFKYRGGVEH